MDIELKRVDIMCPVTKEIMFVPVRLDPCNHVIDRSVFDHHGLTSCPVCNQPLIGYSRSIEVEFRVDEFARKWIHTKSLAASIPLTHQEALNAVTSVYGKAAGLKIYFARNKPYTFVRQKTTTWGWLRYVVDKLFFMFCLMSVVAYHYFV